MRQIKFRAWDKGKRRMSLQPFTIQEVFYNGGDTYAEELNEINDRDDLILMQYTGLKDKNGKEIYEGDIVSLNGVIGYGQPIKENHAVICDNGSPKINNGYEYVFLEEFVFVGNSKHEEFHNDTEIIGNVWENPELIEKP
jgi:uncharacterized phage protein (TIGR01671 family)